MIDDDLPPELGSLFAAERAREAPPADAKARVRGALAISIGGFGGDPSGGDGSGGDGSGGDVGGGGHGGSGGDGGGGDIGSGLDPSAAAAKGAGAKAVGSAAATKTAGAAVATKAATTAAASTATTVATSSALGKGLAIALVTAMAGTAGTGIYLAQADEDKKPRERVVVVEDAPRHEPTIDPSVLLPKDPPAPLPQAKPMEKTPPPKVARAPIAERVEKPLPAAPETTPEQRAERLRVERALLDEARGAVTRGDGGAALIALEAHRDRFPDGQLVEEREALTILALARLDRSEQAKQKAAAFKARWPQSLFAPAIAAAVGE